MDNAEKAIEQVNADQIYTSKQFQRIKDNFFVSKYCDLDMDAHGQLSVILGPGSGPMFSQQFVAM